MITNSTYDGLLYNTTWLKETLDVPSIHFDSAWVPYTHFHPIYQEKWYERGADPRESHLRDAVDA